MRDEDVVVGLVARAVGGDEAAWNALVDRYQPLAVSVINAFGLQCRDAEDVNQTVWLRLVERLEDLREPRALSRWIVISTRHECIRVLREARRTVSVDPLTGVQTLDLMDCVDFDSQLLGSERSRALLEAFAELTDRQRELLLLLIADPPLTYVDIGRRLGMPVGSIGPTRARALQRIRECPAIAALTADGSGPPAERVERGDTLAPRRSR